MKIEQHKYSGFLRIDVQTRRDGNSSARVSGDENMEVYWGGLCTQITLHDLRIQVTMDPDEGDWGNLGWARRRALDVALAPETVSEVIAALCAVNRSVGRIEGRKELQGEISKLLGCV